MVDEAYEAGLRDGKIEAIEKVLANHHRRFEELEQRVRLQDKMTWGLYGAIALVQFLPELKVFFGM